MLAVVIFSFLPIKYIIDASAISKQQLTIKSVQIQEVKVTYTKLKLDIEILNPTNEDISQLSAYYNIFIAGNIVGNGIVPFTDILAQTTKETSTTIIVYYANMTNAVIDTIIKQNFKITIQGTLHAKILFNLLSISQEFSTSYSYS